MRRLNKMKIFGAGIAGLLAGCVFQNSEIYEYKKISEYVGHKALLRFKSNAVSDLTGIKFTKVKVHKGIWMDGGFLNPSIMLSNLYSQKVIGCLADRSIWNLDSVDRWIAPENFIDQLVERCESRIHWGHKIHRGELTSGEKTISTLPFNYLNDMLDGEPIDFKRKPIFVKRWKIPNANVHQTIYYPDPTTNIYRASIVGDNLIAEFTNTFSYSDCSFQDMLFSFGIHGSDTNIIGGDKSYKYEYGKIAEIDDEWRKSFILHLSQQYNIYSLGRFATWRNIVVDDLVQDISVIKRLINASKYDITKSGF
jgi:hypothetical protein